jgi:DNA-binding MarR family transcriptional regulator
MMPRTDAGSTEQALDHAGASCPGGAVSAAGEPRLSASQHAAWVGFLAAHTGIMRVLESGLGAEFGLSVSALEVLARVTEADGGQIRMSDLAQGALLSQSRVSRIVDALELRGLVERTSCPADSRGVFALVTPAGAELAARALQWHWSQVRERFFSTLQEEQIIELGAMWRTVLGGL